MAPCPFVNSFVNHGILPRHGMTKEQLTHAMKDIMKLDSSSTSFFTSSALDAGYTDQDGVKRVDVGNLRPHGVLEHDASMTRDDAALGDNVHVNLTMYNQLRSLSQDSTHITLEDLIQFRILREDDSRTRNPNFTYTYKERYTANGEAAILFLILRADPNRSARDSRQPGIRVDWLDSLIKEERFPAHLGWEPRNVGFFEMLSLLNYIRSRTYRGFTGFLAQDGQREVVV
ncbi:hypothetical protein HDU67_006247 [Dinochytrium kinnereticum]|nr:hypothetical protein HDU67_006247 [Dinochytrium kinnereticum]